MPGPNSAPNGDSRLVHAWDVKPGEIITLREKLRAKGKLRTGKTEAKKNK